MGGALLRETIVIVLVSAEFKPLILKFLAGYNPNSISGLLLISERGIMPLDLGLANNRCCGLTPALLIANHASAFPLCP